MFLTCDDPFGVAKPVERVSSNYKFERNQTSARARAAGESKFAAGTARDVVQSVARVAGESKFAADAARTDVARNYLEPVTVAGENGSELTIDDKNRISIFKDAAGRRFGFAYDEVTGELRAFATSMVTGLERMGKTGAI